MFWFFLIKSIFSNKEKTVIICNFYLDENQSLNNSCSQLDERKIRLSLRRSLPCYLSGRMLTKNPNDNNDIFIDNMTKVCENHITSMFKYLEKSRKYDESKTHILKILDITNFSDFDKKLKTYTEYENDRGAFQIITYFDILIEALIKSCDKNIQLMIKIVNFCSIICVIDILVIFKALRVGTDVQKCYNNHIKINSSLKDFSFRNIEKNDTSSCVDFIVLIYEITNNYLLEIDKGYSKFLSEIDNAFKQLESYVLYLFVRTKNIVICCISDIQIHILSFYMFEHNKSQLNIFQYRCLITILNKAIHLLIEAIKNKFNKSYTVIQYFDAISRIKSEMNVILGQFFLDTGYEYPKKQENKDLKPIQDINTESTLTQNQKSENKEIKSVAPKDIRKSKKKVKSVRKKSKDAYEKIKHQSEIHLSHTENFINSMDTSRSVDEKSNSNIKKTEKDKDSDNNDSKKKNSTKKSKSILPTNLNNPPFSIENNNSFFSLSNKIDQNTSNQELEKNHDEKSLTDTHDEEKSDQSSTNNKEGVNKYLLTDEDVVKQSKPNDKDRSLLSDCPINSQPDITSSPSNQAENSIQKNAPLRFRKEDSFFSQAVESNQDMSKQELKNNFDKKSLTDTDDEGRDYQLFPKGNEQSIFDIRQYQTR